MCGIVGYIGFEQATPFLLDGLEKLEYRGYDSAGVAVYNNLNIDVVKSKGRLQVLKDITDDGKKVIGTIGIGHTRWATHGAPSDLNSHPQTSYSGKFAVVHNGIIENYIKLKDHLIRRGIEFVSETDTEVVAQMLEYYYHGNVMEAIQKTMNRVQGSYSLGIICLDTPDRLYCTKKDSPLIIGIGEKENYIASDIPAILSKTKKIQRLKDREIAVITRHNIGIFDYDCDFVDREIEEINWDVQAAEKAGYEHFMMKEIMEQPEVVRNTISPRVKNGEVVLDDFNLSKEQIEKISKIVIVGCGTAYHVGMVGKYVFEKLLRVSTEVEVASEFRYKSPVVNENTLVVIISQSGETADTLAALREAKKSGAKTLAIVNVVGSSIANESDNVMYTWAGPEIAVASTKAYSTQLAMMYLMGIYMAEKAEKISRLEAKSYIDELEKLPEQIEKILSEKENIQYIAAQHFNANDMYFIGRNIDYAVSLEACLKLKEISYIHSEAYPGGELKHGPISLVEDGTLIIALSTYDKLFDKMTSNIKEVKARGAVILGLATESKKGTGHEFDKAIFIPETLDFMSASLSVIPFQLFSYYVASMRGCDIDKPRNLAKSVTVE